MNGERQTRQVRAYNVRIGDELPFFDTKAMRERRMIVVASEDRDTTFPIHLTIVMKGAKRKQRYLINFKRNQLVRLRRKESRD